jgi:hypothetical protein
VSVTNADWGDAPVPRSHVWRRRIAFLLWVGVLLLVLLAGASFVLWRIDLGEIARVTEPHIDAGAEPVEIVYQARDFVRAHVGYGRPPEYFLHPVFSFMRPTALQVIRGGGDCAYRSRAFIVIARMYGVNAHKRALYNRHGIPMHAVAEVDIDGHPLMYVDLLYNVVHERADGSPLSLAELADEEVLRGSIARAVAAGNDIAAGYPIEEYGFGDVRSLNWDKNPVMRATYRLVATTLGDERARAVPRPYLSEEPALMVIVLSTGGGVVLLVLILVVRPPADRPRRNRQPDEREQRAAVTASGV